MSEETERLARERHRAKTRAWCAKNRERSLAIKRAWRERNRAKIAPVDRARRERNRAKTQLARNAVQRAYYAKNKKRLREMIKKSRARAVPAAVWNRLKEKAK